MLIVSFLVVALTVVVDYSNEKLNLVLPRVKMAQPI